jgi:ABC-type phosphate/phosphonate transport system substrate-binding protein
MKEKDWETKLQEAIVALKEAHKAMDDIAGWSGSSGNWVLQTALPKVEQALEILKPITKE